MELALLEDMERTPLAFFVDVGTLSANFGIELSNKKVEAPLIRKLNK